jgi:hypothetical protein
MRSVIRGIVPLVLALAVPAGAQEPALAPLDRIIETNYEVRLRAHECAVPSALGELARRYQVLAGVEYLMVNCMPFFQEAARDGELLNLRDLSVRQAMQKLVAFDRRYQMTEVEGVVVVRPLESWADARNVLNFTAASFALDDVDLSGALIEVSIAITGTPRSALTSPPIAGRIDHGLTVVRRTEQDGRVFSVKAGRVSVVEALNAILRAHGSARWELKRMSSFEDPYPNVWLHSFDGAGHGASTHPYVAPKKLP